MSRQLYQIMRFQIVLDAQRGGTQFSTAYAYAWANGVYPALREHSHDEDFADDFDLSRDAVTAVLKHMNEKWLAKEALTFYDLEDAFGGKYGDGSSVGPQLDRSDLMQISRYIFLEGDRFDAAFWDALFANGTAPAEATMLGRPFTADELYLD